MFLVDVDFISVPFDADLNLLGKGFGLFFGGGTDFLLGLNCYLVLIRALKRDAPVVCLDSDH